MTDRSFQLHEAPRCPSSLVLYTHTPFRPATMRCEAGRIPTIYLGDYSGSLALSLSEFMALAAQRHYEAEPFSMTILACRLPSQ